MAAFRDLISSKRTCPNIYASHTGAWDLPVIGSVSAPSAVLIRADGYVAWVGQGRIQAS